MVHLTLALATCLLIGVACAVWFRTKANRLSQIRAISDVVESEKYFLQKGVPPEITSVVYEYLSTLPWMRGFPVNRGDELISIYGLAGEELDDLVRHVLFVTNRYVPENNRNDVPTIETVEELIMFISSLPLKSNDIA